MKKVFILALCGLVCGCVTVTKDPKLASKPVAVESKQLNSVKNVTSGMSLPKAKKIMGDQIVVGYAKNEQNQYEPLFLKNPYRIEILEREDKTFQVLYYFTHINQSDDIIAEDELTPLVFQNDVLVGKGWDLLFKIKNGSEK